MRDIKIKPNMDKPKALAKHFTPKDATSLQKKKLEQQKAAKEPESKDGVRYATDKTEYGMRNGTLLAADLSRRTVKRTREKHRETAQSRSVETPLSTSADLPDKFSGKITHPNTANPVQTGTKQPASATAQSNAKSTTIQSVQGTPQNAKSTPRERGRQKAIRDIQEKSKLGRNLAEKGTSTAPTSPEIRPSSSKSLAPNRKALAPKSGGASAKDTFSLKTLHSRKTASLQVPTKAFAQRKAQRKMLQTTARQNKNAARKLGGMTVQAGKAIGRAVTSAVSSIATLGGGVVVLVLLLTVLLVAAIVASPFGIFFSGESHGIESVSISTAAAQINDDFNIELETIKSSGSYDSISVTGQHADWVEVLAVFAVKVAGANIDATDVVIMDADRIERLKAVFWDMTTIEHEVEVIHHLGTEGKEGWTERNLYITIFAKTAEEMKSLYNFSANQISILEELLDQRELLLNLINET